MINKITGDINISDIIIIKHNDLLKDVMSLNIGQTNQKIDHHNGWIWLKSTNVLIANQYFTFHFGFLHNQLKQISFVLSDSIYKLSSDWSTWSERQELDNLERYQKWLLQELGTQRDFDWGNVWALYDPKGGSSSIGMCYK